MTPSEYAKSMNEIGNKIVNGSNSKKTGEYYTALYARDDILGDSVPTLTVELHDKQSQSSNNFYQHPVPLNDMPENAQLQVVPANTTKHVQVRDNGTRTHTTTEQDQQGQIAPTQNQTTTGGSNLSLIIGGFILLAIIGFVLAILRMARINQQKQIISSYAKPNLNKEPSVHPKTQESATQKKEQITRKQPNVRPQQQFAIETPQPKPGVIHNSLAQHTTRSENTLHTQYQDNEPTGQSAQQQWKSHILQMEDKLLQLLSKNNIPGATITDKLNSIGSGQFTATDIAMEAHKSAESLLKNNISIDKQKYDRAIKLYKHVFFIHGLG
jgi:hypothetical protein